MKTEIYVKLLNEDIEVYRPIQAEYIDKNIFKIIDRNDELGDVYGEIWEFNEGDFVLCKYDDKVYKAVEKVNINDK